MISWIYDADNVIEYLSQSTDSKKFKLLLIGHNNIPEGGLYMSYDQKNYGAIFSVFNKWNIAQESERVLIANYFSEMLCNARFYQISRHHGSKSHEYLDLGIPECLEESLRS